MRGARVKFTEVIQKPVQVNNSNTSPSCAIGRREAVQKLLTGAGGTLIVPALRSKHTVHRHPADAAAVEASDASAVAIDWTPEFLDAHQNESLMALAQR